MNFYRILRGKNNQFKIQKKIVGVWITLYRDFPVDACLQDAGKLHCIVFETPITIKHWGQLLIQLTRRSESVSKR